MLTMSIPSLDKRALVVEDDLTLRPLVVSALLQASPGIQVDWVESAEEGLNKLDTNHYEVIIADLWLKGSENGLRVWFHSQETCPETPVLMTSGITIPNFLRMVGQESICPPFLPKPFKLGECKQVLRGLLSFANVSS